MGGDNEVSETQTSQAHEKMTKLCEILWDDFKANQRRARCGNVGTWPRTSHPT